MQFGQNMRSNGTGKAQLIQRMESVGPKRDARADFAQHRRALVHVGLDAGLVQSACRGDPADSPSNDNGFHKSPTNLPQIGLGAECWTARLVLRVARLDQ